MLEPIRKMDVAQLRERIATTLQADADARRRAELDLKAVCTRSVWDGRGEAHTGYRTDCGYRLRNTRVSRMHYLISFRASRRLVSDLPVCQKDPAPYHIYTLRPEC